MNVSSPNKDKKLPQIENFVRNSGKYKTQLLIFFFEKVFQSISVVPNLSYQSLGKTHFLYSYVIPCCLNSSKP